MDSSVPDTGTQAFEGGTTSEASTVDSGPDGSEAGAVANVLISDQFNNRVIEVDPTGAIVWTFGDGTSTPGPTSVVAPNDAERLPNGQTLISGTGAPPGTEPTCPSDGGGCPDNRVLIVSADGGIVWQYGDDGGLNTPVASVYLPNGNVLITDQGNQRVIEVTPQKTIAWQYMPLTADGGPAFNSPNSAERLANGNTLITDENNNRVIEVTNDGGIAWQYPTDDAGLLSGAAFASRLDNGDTLITSANNATILEVDATGRLVWAYYTTSRSLVATAPVVDGGNPAPLPTRAVRLANDHTLISDQFNNQVIEIDSAGNLVSQFGQLDVAGNSPGQLNAPYDAKRIGDFTGLTSPQ